MTASLYTPGGLPLPDLDDPPNVPADLLALAGELDLRVENRFNTTGDRDATLPAAATPIGTRCLITTTGRRYIVWPTTGGNTWFEVIRGHRLVVATDAVRDSLMVVNDGMEVYRATDGVVFTRIASAWVPDFVADTEVTYAAGWGNYTDATAGWNGMRYTRRNGIVTVSGAIRATSAVGANSVITTLPAGFRPTHKLEASIPAQPTNVVIDVGIGGVVTTNGAQASGFVTALPPITFVAAP